MKGARSVEGVDVRGGAGLGDDGVGSGMTGRSVIEEAHLDHGLLRDGYMWQCHCQ